MAETSAISWTRSTFNPWIGCTKVGPGCDSCYADALDVKRFSKTLGGATSEIPIRHWGAGAPRHRTSIHNWNEPLRWNRKAEEEQRTGILTPKATWPGRIGHWPVFCASLADVFDNEVDQAWRADLWHLILATPALSWLLVTKRIGNVPAMVPGIWITHGFLPNVRLLITAVNQEEVDRDVRKLLALRCKNGVSYEPALGGVDWLPWMSLPPGKWPGLQWIIVGGESGQGGVRARPFVIGWARNTVQQCQAARVPVFVKQLGSNPVNREGEPHRIKDSSGSDLAEWPEDLRVQEIPA